MGKYNAYLEELKSTTLFQDLADDEIISLLEAMHPEIVMRKAGDPMPPMPEGTFKMILRSTPAREMIPRKFKYDMPKFGEPGMLMMEIPTLSRMGDGLKEKKNFRHPGVPKPLDYDMEMLEFTEDMVTRPYGADVAKAQGIMLRNFLGILAQKVCDVRHELFLIKDGRDMFQEKEKTLQIFTAGVAMKLVKEAVQKWNLSHPELQAELTPGGSVDLIRRVLQGERCDVLISADDSIIESMMMPEYAEGYRIFAGNRMVVAGKGINSGNWKEKLLDPKATFKHNDPYGDPGGYRAVMSLLLADQVEDGLSEKLMNHPGHVGMEKTGPGRGPEADYKFYYYSGAAASGEEFAELPEVMDLSSEELADVYQRAEFAVDPENTVTGAPIRHACTIPTGAKYKEAAKEFLKLFLASDFEAACFIPKVGGAGKDPIAQE